MIFRGISDTSLLPKKHISCGRRESLALSTHFLTDVVRSWVEYTETLGTTLYVYRDGWNVLYSYPLFRQTYDPETSRKWWQNLHFFFSDVGADAPTIGAGRF
jgi:hypothetical protein